MQEIRNHTWNSRRFGNKFNIGTNWKKNSTWTSGSKSEKCMAQQILKKCISGGKRSDRVKKLKLYGFAGVATHRENM